MAPLVHGFDLAGIVGIGILSLPAGIAGGIGIVSAVAVLLLVYFVPGNAKCGSKPGS